MGEKSLFGTTLIVMGRVGLALAIALVSRWHVWQWQVPKAWARIFLGCGAVGIVRRVVVRQPRPVPFLFFFFQVQRCLGKGLVVTVEKLDRWRVERYFVVVENLSGCWKGIVANVCVCAVVAYRSRVPSTCTKVIK
jgi:hypothetical protein